MPWARAASNRDVRDLRILRLQMWSDILDYLREPEMMDFLGQCLQCGTPKV